MRIVASSLTAIALVGLVGASSLVPPAFAAEFNDGQRQEIVDTVRDYLLKNPEFLREVMAALEKKDQQQQLSQAEGAITENAAQIFRDASDQVSGNPKGDVTVVEFFDYNCGYCKRAFPDVNAMLDQDKQVRLVVKEFPILGPGSLVASKAAMASVKQGKYWEFHNAMMAHKGSLDEASVLATAKTVGLDVTKLKTDMEAPEIAAQIEKTYKLAQTLGIQGTPAFVIGNQFVPGAIGSEELGQRVSQVRSDGSCKIC